MISREGMDWRSDDLNKSARLEMRRWQSGDQELELWGNEEMLCVR